MAEKPTKIDPDDWRFDPFIIYGFDGFGHTVRLGQAATEEQALSLHFDLIQKYRKRYDPIYVVQVLDIWGDESIIGG